MDTQLIQQKVTIGGQVTVTLETNEKISGLLIEIGINHITSGYSRWPNDAFNRSDNFLSGYET